MRTRLVTKVTIDGTADQVFRYFKYLKYHQLWHPHMQEISKEGPVKEGLEYEATYLLLGVKVVGRNRVLKYLPNREFAVQNTTASINYLVKFQLQDKGSQTQVTCTTTISTRGEGFAFTVPLLRLLARRELQSDLHALKTAVEKQSV